MFWPAALAPLLLNAAAAIAMAGAVAQLLAAELGRDEQWQRDQVAEFTSIAQNYLIHPAGRAGISPEP